MTSQTRALQFVKSYLKILEDLGTSDDALAPFVDALRSVDETPGDNLTGELDHPLMPLLEGALAAAEGPQELIESIIDLAGEGGFQQVYEGEGINAPAPPTLTRVDPGAPEHDCRPFDPQGHRGQRGHPV